MASQAGESVTLLIANDGAPQSGIDCRDGVGLENLETRLAAIGGTLTVEFQDGTFCLSAAVPHTPFAERPARPAAQPGSEG
jgi:signal transduction histidine kinase